LKRRHQSKMELPNMSIEKIVALADGGRSGGGGNTGKKPWRSQTVFIHSGEEVRRHEYFLRDNDQFLEPGEYDLAPDAVYFTQRAYVDKGGRSQTRTEFACANRFVKRPLQAKKAA
jgi:hypothetical protein